MESLYLIKNIGLGRKTTVEIRPTLNSAVEYFDDCIRTFVAFSGDESTIQVVKVRLPDVKYAKKIFMKLLKNPDKVNGEIIKECIFK